jgi:hemolysin III
VAKSIENRASRRTDPTALNMYLPAEERINVLSHAFGLLLSIVGLILLVIHARKYGSGWDLFGFTVFGASLVILYAASTWYHSTADPDLRRKLRIVDHAAIYVLIAGTYTPIALTTLSGTTGNLIFAITWSMAICGIGLKLFFTGRFNLLSTAMYVAMGWMMVFLIGPMRESLASGGITWIAVGGFSYTAGAILYSFKSINFGHAIFHLFVLVGSISHFITVYYYVLPVP